MNARITDYIVNAQTSDGSNIFIGITNANSVRVGWAEGMITAFPAEHSTYKKVMDARKKLLAMTGDQVEAWIERERI